MKGQENSEVTNHSNHTEDINLSNIDRPETAISTVRNVQTFVTKFQSENDKTIPVLDGITTESGFLEEEDNRNR